MDFTNPGYGTSYFTGVAHGGFTVTAYDARGYVLGQISGTLSTSSRTVAFHN